LKGHELFHIDCGLRSTLAGLPLPDGGFGAGRPEAGLLAGRRLLAVAAADLLRLIAWRQGNGDDADEANEGEAPPPFPTINDPEIAAADNPRQAEQDAQREWWKEHGGQFTADPDAGALPDVLKAWLSRTLVPPLPQSAG
jgi:hypothetical protein